METKKFFTVEDLMKAIAENSQKSFAVERAEDEAWATSSQFYNQVMEDGHIFNPYLHRRWLPSQFLRVLKYNDMDAYAGVKRCYGFIYFIEWVKDEVRKLAYLQKVDPVAFEERKNFLSIETVKAIVTDYVLAASNFANEEAARWRTVRVGKRRFVRSNIENLITELMQFNSSVQSVITYESLDEILQAHDVVKVGYYVEKPDSFVSAFIKSGAYYTLKHLVLFEKLTINGKSGADACAEVNNCVDKSADVIYRMLLKTIEDNNYKF